MCRLHSPRSWLQIPESAHSRSRRERRYGRIELRVCHGCAGWTARTQNSARLNGGVLHGKINPDATVTAARKALPLGEALAKPAEPPGLRGAVRDLVIALEPVLKRRPRGLLLVRPSPAHRAGANRPAAKTKSQEKD
jgi:hypothetical protein